MKYALAPIFLALTTIPAIAENNRQLDAHEHGVGELNIAIEGATIAAEFHAPGADIVGFEHPVASDEDQATVDAALAKLSDPLSLFTLPDAATCALIDASAELEGEDAHDDHDDHGHDDHAEKDDDHGEQAHGEEHDDHDHDEHAHKDEVGHTEFHVEFQITCANPSAIDTITFNYFDAFKNAREVEVQMVTESGASAYEVQRDNPVLSVSGLF